ncbi:MAG: ferric reductase-like transmembrane domain-containing protein, partial [Acidimicrobiia bacterium]|nr:ferric reductase-like transmembrane domain-containing protein [Acidimicrobiia bacterium]
MTAARPTEALPRRARPLTVPPEPWRTSQDQREALVLAVIVAGGLAVLGIWWGDTPGRGLHTIADRLTAAGRITGLVGTYLVLVQVVLMARLPWLDRWVGTDRMAAWHRTNGQYTIAMLAAHTVLIVLGYAAADHVSVVHETNVVLRSYPDVLAATVALGLLVVVAVTSIREARRRLRYETWYFIHLYTYIAIALAFSHQLATGNDFVGHAANRVLWAVLFVAVFGLLLVYRVGVPVRDAFRYRLRVHSIRDEGADAVSVYLTGRGVGRMDAHAGQFFRWRFLDRRAWWE